MFSQQIERIENKITIEIEAITEMLLALSKFMSSQLIAVSIGVLLRLLRLFCIILVVTSATIIDIISNTCRQYFEVKSKLQGKQGI